MSATDRPDRPDILPIGARLSLVRTTASSAWTERRPAVLRVCVGEAMLLSEDEVDFVQLVNTAAELSTFLVDDTRDPATTTSPRSSRSASATYGITQHGKGAQLVSLISAYRRHLIPFLVEPAANRPSGQESVSPLPGVALTA